MKIFRPVIALALALAGLATARAQVPLWAKTTPADIAASGIGAQVTGADYGNGTFVLAAYFGGFNTPIVPAVYTSPDGTTWTKRTLPVTGARVGSPRFLNGKFYLGMDAAANANGVPTGVPGAVLSSADGITWSAATLTTPLFGPNNFVYGNGVYLAIATPASGQVTQVVTSADGVSWTPRTVVAGASGASVAFFNGKFYCTLSVTNGANALYASADAVTWTRVTTAPTNLSTFFSLAASPATLIVPSGAFGSNTQSLSADGATFTTAAPGIALVAGSIRYVNGAFVTPAPDTSSTNDVTLARASFDGRTWTTIGATTNFSDGVEIAYGNGRYVFVGEFNVFTGTTTIAPGGTASGGGGGGNFASYAGTYTGTIYVSTNGAAETVFTTFNGTVSATGALVAQGGEVTGTVGSTGTVTFANNGLGLTTGTIVNQQLGATGAPTVLGATTRVYRIAATGGTGGTTPAPTVTAQPAASQSVALGGSVTFIFTVTGTGITYQWFFNGIAISGAVNFSYTLGSVTAANAGTYTVTATNAGGSVTSTASVLTVAAASNIARLSNVSIRAGAGSDSQTLIVGVTVGGAGTSGSKNLLVRGTGPALTAFNVPGALADPVLTVFTSTGVNIAGNDDWNNDAQVIAQGAALGAFALPASSKDAALVGTIPSGGYTVQLTGKAGATGVALVEVYDATASFTAATPRLTNVSARTQVGTGGNILITGFVIAGSGTRQVLIRATGPALAAFGVDGTLADPKLELYNSAGVKTDENDNWVAATAAAQASVGAFPLTVGSKDSVIVATLAPGSYTAQVSGVGATTGVALVEIYELP